MVLIVSLDTCSHCRFFFVVSRFGCVGVRCFPQNCKLVNALLMCSFVSVRFQYSMYAGVFLRPTRLARTWRSMRSANRGG